MHAMQLTELKIQAVSHHKLSMLTQAGGVMLLAGLISVMYGG